MKLTLTDRLTIPKTRRTSDGYLVGEAPVARTGIQEYRGHELGLDAETVRVYRPASEVFAAEAMATFAHRPITLDHPRDPVTADNWRDFAIGQTGGEVARDGETIRVPMVLMDARAIDAWQRGKRELSMGYEAMLDPTPGTTPDGHAYDVVMRDLRMNHLALVDAARAGPDFRLDSEETTMSDKLKTVTIDGLPVETTDAGAQAISALQDRLKTANDKVSAMESEHAKALAAKDAELAKRDAEIDTLKAKVLSDADLDARVASRASLIAQAKRISDQEYKGSEADIRKAAVVAKLGADAVKDKSAEYIAARFDILAEADPVRDAVKSGIHRPQQASDAYNAYAKHLEDAWKQPTGGTQ